MIMTFFRCAALVLSSAILFAGISDAQNTEDKGTLPQDHKAEDILAKAVQDLGGDSYLRVRSEIGRGRYSVFRDRAVVLSQSFIDVIVFPDKERTEFKGGGSRTIQANTGSTGWVYDGDQNLIKLQNEAQVANFHLALRTSIDYLLRGAWRSEGELTYVGKRAATLGKRNDVVKLTFKDGFAVEFEFSDDGLPQKAIYSITAVDGEAVKEEDRYAQFVEVDGVKAPFIVDRFRGGMQVSRINYESIEFNRTVPDSYFAKPATPKEIKSDIK